MVKQGVKRVCRSLRRFGDDAEHDGPLNARARFKHIPNQLRWVVVDMSIMQGRPRADICRTTGLYSRTISRILRNWQLRGDISSQCG
jgi:hypothetical protein